MGKLQSTDDTGQDALARYDAIIDVRSPAEFAEDHIPGAVNLPVLSNEERAEVGTTYKQVSTFLARRAGAAHVARNVALHLETFFADQPPRAQFLIYCWRGGMRSGSMATIVSQVGWRTTLLQGGYKTWRRAVSNGLRDDGQALNLVLVDGQTGTAKTDILHSAAKQGAQVLDLEGLANHRGSVFGGMGDGSQPGQKLFESRLWAALQELDSDKPILVEAESNRIGKREIPKRVWKAMQAAPSITVEASQQARARYLTRAYGDIIANPERILQSIDALRKFHAKTIISEWREMVASGAYEQLALELIRDHYDAMYKRSRQRRAGKRLQSIRLDALDEADIAAAASTLIGMINND